MRKIILPFLFSCAAAIGQTAKPAYLSVSGGFDIRNAAIGSKPTNDKPALNWLTQFDCVGAGVHIIAGYERFDAIKYDRMFAGIGYEFPLYAYAFNSEIKTAFIPSVDYSIIKRTITETYTYEGKQYSTTGKAGFGTFGLNLAFQWDLTDHFGLRLATKIQPRPDVEYMYGTKKTEIANYVSFVYKFNKN